MQRPFGIGKNILKFASTLPQTWACGFATKGKPLSVQSFGVRVVAKGQQAQPKAKSYDEREQSKPAKPRVPLPLKQKKEPREVEKIKLCSGARIPTAVSCIWSNRQANNRPQNGWQEAGQIYKTNEENIRNMYGQVRRQPQVNKEDQSTALRGIAQRGADKNQSELARRLTNLFFVDQLGEKEKLANLNLSSRSAWVPKEPQQYMDMRKGLEQLSRAALKQQLELEKQTQPQPQQQQTKKLTKKQAMQKQVKKQLEGRLKQQSKPAAKEFEKARAKEPGKSAKMQTKAPREQAKSPVKLAKEQRNTNKPAKMSATRMTAKQPTKRQSMELKQANKRQN